MKKLLLAIGLWLGLVSISLGAPATTQVTQDLWTSQCAVDAILKGAGPGSVVACLPTPTVAGSIAIWNGSWTIFPGNTSGTQFLSEGPTGVLSWAPVAGSGTVTSIICAGVTITTSGTCAPVGQFPGLGSNVAATAGNVGEVISSTILSASAVSLTTATAANVTSVSLTAGDWNCWGNVAYKPTGTTVQAQLGAAINTTSATLPTSPNSGGETLLQLPFTNGGTNILSAGQIQILINTTTTVYLIAYAQFGTSTLGAYGSIYCRRAR